ncbi:MAG: hypothetical protein ACOCUY_00140 [Verrucomicrobiota bacterium]
MNANKTNAPTEHHPRIMTGDIEEEAAPSPDRVEKRARELAVLAGRTSEEVSEEDRRRAFQELQGEDFELNENEPSATARAVRDPSEPVVDEQHQQPERHPRDEALAAEELAKEGSREAEHEELLEGQDQYRDTGGQPERNL